MILRVEKCTVLISQVKWFRYEIVSVFAFFGGSWIIQKVSQYHIQF